MAENCTSYSKCVKYKVVLAGKYGVGKTSLFRRMFDMGFNAAKPSGIGFKIHKETFAEHNMMIELEIWDTAEMEKHGSITQSYYRGSHFALLVYSTNDETSLNELEGIADDVRKYEPSAKLFVVRNKIDLTIGKDGVSVENQDQYISEIKHRIHSVFPTSAKENKGIKELLKQLASHALQLSKGRATPDKKGDAFESYITGKPNPSQKKGCCS